MLKMYLFQHMGIEHFIACYVMGFFFFSLFFFFDACHWCDLTFSNIVSQRSAEVSSILCHTFTLKLIITHFVLIYITLLLCVVGNGLRWWSSTSLFLSIKNFCQIFVLRFSTIWWYLLAKMCKMTCLAPWNILWIWNQIILILLDDMKFENCYMRRLSH